MRNPVQPLAKDNQGVLRFKKNAIVEYLLEHGGIDLNHLAGLDFNEDDRQQFAQLIGYSLSGYGDLSYVDEEAYAVAQIVTEQGISEDVARIQYLEGELIALRSALREPMARLFEIHPDDLKHQ